MYLIKLFSFACWSIWKNRNRHHFHQSLPSTSSAQPTTKLFSYQDILARAREWHLLCSKSSPSRASTISVGWTKPVPDRSKLNTNGALSSNGFGAAGGIIRDGDGHWVSGFRRSIGISSTIATELWVIKDGLTLALDNNIQDLDIEPDVMLVVQLLQDMNIVSHPLFQIHSDCRALLERFRSTSIKHV